ncbi:MAG TPA: hemerythrin domain-containing protein [Planctomycetaceae bacterium]|nr:hemerythrin domain-containing protein [Planctomycetaceae bacterium]HQZ66834.1 hemerythrin domain-containing protein [Planctomycetaceae bacterium]HRA87425.1 hemerythrin domain-containing protein [Planctomycetaceae bacterium]
MIGSTDESTIEKLLKDHRVLMDYICSVREWIRDVSEWGMPRFGELGTRLTTFRETLAAHFEDEESQEYAILDSQHEPAVAGATREWPNLHHDYLKQLDVLVQCLRALEPEFETWQEAVRQVDTLITEICEHEDREIQFLQNSLSQTK